MRLHVHRSGGDLLQTLKTTDGAYYATFARSTIDPGVLREIDEVARARGHRDLSAVAALRPAAECLLRAFFDRAAHSDPDSRFAYSSRVLLAVPDYPDVALVFVLRALKTAEPQATVHALIEDGWQAALARHEVEGGGRPAFRPGRWRSIARGARSLARRFFSRPAPRACDVLLFTLGDNPARNTPDDAYFADLAGTLAEKCRVTTVYLAPGARLRFPRQIAALPLETFLAPADAIEAWTKARHPGPHEGRTDDDVVACYLRAREHASGDVFMQALMANMFERMLMTLKPDTVVYPFENRSWEKKLLKAARRHEVRCIGYQHSSITPRHLALSGGTGFSRSEDIPDEIVTCGEITAGLIRAGIPKARVTVGTALRARRLTLSPAAQWGVLAPISSSRAEAWEILRLLHELGGEPATPIVVRTHPTIPIDDLYAQFRWPAHVRLSRGRSLADDFAATSLVAYSSSTVALEGMLYGRLPIYLDIGDIPSGNPIHGKHDFLFRAATGEELRGTIARLRALTPGELAVLREQAHAYAERYLIEPTRDNVQRMADAIASC